MGIFKWGRTETLKDYNSLFHYINLLKRAKIFLCKIRKHFQVRPFQFSSFWGRKYLGWYLYFILFIDTGEKDFSMSTDLYCNNLNKASKWKVQNLQLSRSFLLTVVYTGYCFVWLHNIHWVIFSSIPHSLLLNIFNILSDSPTPFEFLELYK